MQRNPTAVTPNQTQPLNQDPQALDQKEKAKHEQLKKRDKESQIWKTWAQKERAEFNIRNTNSNFWRWIKIDSYDAKEESKKEGNPSMSASDIKLCGDGYYRDPSNYDNVFKVQNGAVTPLDMPYHSVLDGDVMKNKKYIGTFKSKWNTVLNFLQSQGSTSIRLNHFTRVEELLLVMEIAKEKGLRVTFDGATQKMIDRDPKFREIVFAKKIELEKHQYEQHRYMPLVKNITMDKYSKDLNSPKTQLEDISKDLKGKNNDEQLAVLEKKMPALLKSVDDKDEVMKGALTELSDDVTVVKELIKEKNVDFDKITKLRSTTEFSEDALLANLEVQKNNIDNYFKTRLEEISNLKKEFTTELTNEKAQLKDPKEIAKLEKLLSDEVKKDVALQSAKDALDAEKQKLQATHKEIAELQKKIAANDPQIDKLKTDLTNQESLQKQTGEKIATAEKTFEDKLIASPEIKKLKDQLDNENKKPTDTTKLGELAEKIKKLDGMEKQWTDKSEQIKTTHTKLDEVNNEAESLSTLIVTAKNNSAKVSP